MTPHSSTLAWRIPWTEEPDRLQSVGVIELDMTEATEHKEQLLIIFRCMVFNLFS